MLISGSDSIILLLIGQFKSGFLQHGGGGSKAGKDRDLMSRFLDSGCGTRDVSNERNAHITAI